jgi:hypothetical protein
MTAGLRGAFSRIEVQLILKGKKKLESIEDLKAVRERISSTHFSNSDEPTHG